MIRNRLLLQALFLWEKKCNHYDWTPDVLKEQWDSWAQKPGLTQLSLVYTHGPLLYFMCLTNMTIPHTTSSS